MINEIVSAVETSLMTVLFAMILIAVWISVIWAMVQAYKAWKTFRRFVGKGRSH